MPLVADYSWARPSPSLLRQHYVGVVRYVGDWNANGKYVSPGEYQALKAAGLEIALVWETSAGRTLDGFGAGQQDAASANDWANRLGFPAGRPLYFAVDTDVWGWGAVAPYFDGVRAASGRPVGVYGEFDVVEGAADAGIPYRWATAAWSRGRQSGRAQLYQYARPAQVAGCDDNEVLSPDWGQDVGAAPPPPQRREFEDSLLLN